MTCNLRLKPVFRNGWHLDFLLVKMTDHKPKPFLAWFLAALKSARLEMPQGRSSCRACRSTAGRPKNAVVLRQQRQTRFSGKNHSKAFPCWILTEPFALQMLCFVTDITFFLHLHAYQPVSIHPLWK